MRLRFVCCWMVELRPCSMCDWTWLNKKNAGISSCAVWNSFVPCFLRWHLLISVSCFRLYLQHVLTIVRISVGYHPGSTSLWVTSLCRLFFVAGSALFLLIGGLWMNSVSRRSATLWRAITCKMDTSLSVGLASHKKILIPYLYQLSS